MFDSKMQLLSTVFAEASAELAANDAALEPWARAHAALEPTRESEPDLAAVIDAKDAAELAALVAGWTSGERLLPEQDRGVLKRAMKAYRKSLKVTRLDAESTIGGGPMSAGRSSGILGMRPPERYSRDVWDALVRQGRLIDAKEGMYELPPE